MREEETQQLYLDVEAVGGEHRVGADVVGDDRGEEEEADRK